MDDEFQDFSSDASDFDDDVDWSFTDGESARILHLMGEASSAKKATQVVGIDAVPLPIAVNSTATTAAEPNAAVCMPADAEEAPAGAFADEELLNELFPEMRSEFVTRGEKPVELHAKDDERGRGKECEVEWALMALEEHAQLGQKTWSTSSASGDTDLSLFEEMYGGDTVLALSTPSPPADHSEGRQRVSKQEDVRSTAKDDDVGLAPKIVDETDERLSAEVLDMLRVVYTSVTETREFFALLKNTSGKLCLQAPDCESQLSESRPSLASLANAVCFFEESIANQQLVKSVAATREERLELVLVALDDQVGALPRNMKVKWAKMLAMLPVLAKMQQQSPNAPPPAPPARSKDRDSPLQGWATFHPDKMPARRCESMKTPKTMSSSSRSTVTKKTLVRIRQYPPAKLRVRCKVYNPDERELTFRPQINKKYTPSQPKETFAARMDKDISYRRSQQAQHEKERAQHERDEAASVSAAKLIAKGSERILLKNGVWAESFEERLRRLTKHRTNVGTGAPRSKKQRKRQKQREREAAAAASRACESLYQRGMEQRKRAQERLQEDLHDLEFQRNRPKMSSRSLKVMKTRIRQELAQLCADSHRAEACEETRTRSESGFVTFVQFSCALLYFGFVADLNTPWEGAGESSEITLLWHSWTVFTRGDTDSAGPTLAVKVLERALFAVILGERAGEHHRALRSREGRALLRLYRANYYARKHTQLKLGVSVDRVQAGAETREGQPNTPSSCQRQRVRYSLHGKPIRSTATPEADVLSEREQLLQEKIDQMREAKARQELEGCTFHPSINLGPSQARVARRTSPSPSPKSSSATVSTFERLYSDAFQRQNNVLEKYLEAKLRREELEKRECQVQPSYVNGLTIEERLENLHVALAGSALPVDFHKKIEAMRTAAEMKAFDEQLKEQRLQPAQFKRAQDGRTIVLPFRFATEIRAGLSAGMKKQRAKAAHHPRDHVMKGLRPLAEEAERGAPPTEELSPKAHEVATCDEDREADVCLDVHLSPTETQQLFLSLHDDPHEVVERFARRFLLSKTQRHFLVQLVEARREQFTTSLQV